jgi:ADP-ribosylglycohydrolase
MPSLLAETSRLRGAWQGRISGCLLGKPLEVLSFEKGREGLLSYLLRADALPLRDYVPFLAGTSVERHGKLCCRGHIRRAEPDDDINYTVLALMLLENHGVALTTKDVARAWIRLLPAGATWTAERAAYKTLLCEMANEFVNGADPGFDLAQCSDNAWNEWIGGQIRADLYGWVCPGRPELAADLATRDASLSHRNDGVHGAAFIAALGAAIPVTADIGEAVQVALQQIPENSGAAQAVKFGFGLAAADNAVEQLHAEYAGMSPVHTLNNLAVVVWALSSAHEDFSAAIGNAVTAGWDTDCNGATVGGLFGLTGLPIPTHWTKPWAGHVGVSLAGLHELSLDDLVARSVEVSRRLAAH